MKYQIIPVTAFSQNCTLIWCEQSGQAALVDPGGEAEKLKAAVQDAGVQLTKFC
ncbi:Uncharacterised protein [Serratia rubidaea]|uniref:Hydroxyacylglutathione hydrolase n=1 Tax=Serratia rubidaea TaxID=61652 RepID=A0A3S4JUU4_SERRU|nr:Uncharacterised protein [Serratia rubidaea]